VEWDAVKKTVSVAGEIQAFTPQVTTSAAHGNLAMASFTEALLQYTQAAEAVLRQEAMAQVGGEIVVGSVLDGPAGKEFQAAQRGNLTGLAAQAGYALTVDREGLWEKFLSVSPEWKEENKTQTMKRMNLSENNFYYYREAEFNGYAKYIDVYNENVGKMLEAGMNAILAARAGRDAMPYITALNSAQSNTSRVDVLAKPPNFQKIIEACQAILEQKSQELVQSRIAAAGVADNILRKLNNPGPTFAGSGTASEPTNRAAEAQATLQRTLDVIMNSEGTGTVAQRIAGYLEAYGGVLGTTVVDAGLHGAATDEVSGSLVVEVNAANTKEASDFLALNAAPIRQQLLAYMDTAEVDAGLAYLQQNPDVLIQADPQAFTPIQIASAASSPEIIAMAARSNTLKKSAVLKLLTSGAANLPEPGNTLHVVGVDEGVRARALEPASLYNQMRKAVHDTVLQEMTDMEKLSQLISDPQTGLLMKFGLSVENLASASVVVGLQGSNVFSNLMDMAADSALGDLTEYQKMLQDPATPFISKPFIAVGALGSSSTIVLSQVFKTVTPNNFVSLALVTMAIPSSSARLVVSDAAAFETAVKSEATAALEGNTTNARVLVKGAEGYFVEAEKTAEELNAYRLLMPEGRAIGESGSSYIVREVQGGTAEARQLFDELVRGGTKIKDQPDLITYCMPDGTNINFRIDSISGGPAIDVNDYLGVGYKRIHFYP
jgi:hypothetical protein